MNISDIIKYRLHNQQIATPSFKDAGKVVAWMGAIQAQDYGAAKWALGQRVYGANDNDIEKAFANGSILRTHLMRPTWHFVTPADIRWLLTLTAPRIKAQCTTAYRWFELDDATFRKSNKALTKALQGGKQLTRDEIAIVLKKAKVNIDGLRFIHLLMHAELDGVLCSGGRQGKQFTYALLDDRVPQSKFFDLKEALAELTIRYFTSHGPAALQDFAWWSGLTLSMAKEGMEMVKSQFINEVTDGNRYWFSPSLPSIKNLPQRSYLLPNYDEYTVAYKDRSMLLDKLHTNKLDSRGNVLFMNVIIVNGRIAGVWKRTLKTNDVVVETTLFTSLTKSQTKAIAAAINNYKKFISN